jgi:hypothetical protein
MVRTLAAALLVAGCASQPPSPGAFSFAVMGDTPYNDREAVQYLRMMKVVDAADVAFVIHVGDIDSGASKCEDELYSRRKAEFDASAHPFIYTPGDNEWTDCRRNKSGHRDSLERLAHLRGVFFASAESLGRTRIATELQSEATPGCTAYPENRAWTSGGVRFVTLNIPGSHNNVGFDAASDAEARCRNAANARWLDRSVTAVESAGLRALVVAIQANPWIGEKHEYDGLLAQLGDAARRLAKPVLFVHGDTHTYRVDAPFPDAPGITRLEVYGSPFVGWVRVDVDPARPGLFTFDPKLQALVP